MKHTVSFAIFGTAFLAVMYFLGNLLKPANMAFQFNYALVAAATILVWALLTFVFVIGWFTFIFHMSVGGVFSDLKKKYHESGYENLSRAFMICGLIILTGQLVGWSGSATMRLFFYSLLTRGAIALAATAVTTIIASWILGIGSMDSFKEYFDDPRNNQVVLVIMTVVNVVAFLVMTLKSSRNSIIRKID